MYIVEPILNRFYRKRMRAAIEFDQTGLFDVPARREDDKDDYLLYMHIPFCETLCPYCSFHRYEYQENIADKYFDALHQGLKMYKAHGYDFSGMYIGGGTPTISIDRLIETIGLAKNLFKIKEISVETNPNHLTAEKMDRLVGAGINRLSVGVQTFDDKILKHIGRYEKYGSGEEIKEKVRSAVGRFDTLNVDLIFNIPLQTEDHLKKDLDIIEELLPEQVTFYPLMAATSVENALKNSVGRVDYKKEKKFYFTILDRMRETYTGSTAWCFSRKKSMIDEYIISYDKYVGAGSGAFGYFNDSIYSNSFSIDEYIGRIEQGKFPVAGMKKFSKQESMHYYFLMKLFGLSMDKSAFEKKFGKSLGKAMPLEKMMLKLSSSVKETEKTITLTEKGMYYWIMAMREFFIATDNLRDHCRSLVKGPS